MAKKPSKVSGSKISNVIGLLRGNFNFNTPEDNNTPVAYGSPELLSKEGRSKILQGVFQVTEPVGRNRVTQASLLGIVQTSLSKVGAERLENRKILQLVPEVDKAARLMIASTFSPNDLARHEIPVIFDTEDLTETYLTRLSDHATNFFQKKLNLKKAAVSWVYQWGYEAGACVFAIVPMRSFEKIYDDSFVGTENLITKVIDPLSQISLFGFGDSPTESNLVDKEITALESFTHGIFQKQDTDTKTSISKSPTHLKTLIKQVIGSEALSLTDNPDILNVSEMAKEKTKKRTEDVLNKRYRDSKRKPRPKTQTLLSVSPDRGTTENPNVLGNPILMRLPPEAVTVIHTPGDPNDHQGYLILLDHLGNPLDATRQKESADSQSMGASNVNQNNIFSQVFNAYGFTNGFRGISNEETMNRIYTEIVSEHIRKRMDKAGFSNVSIGNSDSVFRCMFARFMEAKQTRILFLPKNLVSYMTFETDQNGYGVSRLDRIKFSLGMKMAVQVSRVLASIKAAMDNRKIEIKFTDNMLEQPEMIFENVISEYLKKSTMSFSVDPNVIQNQIADKSISIKGIDIPGMEQFDLTNEPDNKTSSSDFDPSIMEYLDKQILNGLHVPPATMNSLGEDEYARSVTTTNLFFSMDVSIDQDIVIHCVSDLLQKYARYSSEFQEGIYEIFSSLRPEGQKKDISSTEDDKPEDSQDDDFQIPEEYTIDRLINEMKISLPHPNVAPSKAQFEALDAMVTSITNTVGALFPDDLMGSDDSLSATIRFLRAKFTTMNIRSYLEGSGMTSLVVPESNFSEVLADSDKLLTALQNVSEMMKDKVKIMTPGEPADDSGTSVPGYE